MSASLENGLKVSWPPLTGTCDILVELKDVDEGLEWILMPRSTSRSVAQVPMPAFNANQQVEIRGIPELALNYHEFEATVYSCARQATPGTASSFQVAQSYRATCSTSGQDDDLGRQFSGLNLTSSRTVSRSYHGECFILIS